MAALAHGLRIEPRPLSDWETNFSRVGVGLSDSATIASRLPSKVLFTNTFLDRFPTLDLLHPPEDAVGHFEFALCSDVLEHVPPPAQRGFVGLAGLLRPGGFTVVSVPLASEGVEFYPDLVDFEVVGESTVRWRDGAGEVRLDESPEFHGGQGLVLSFRRFSSRQVMEWSSAAGFASCVTAPADPRLGVWELPSAGVFLVRRS